MQWRLCTGRGVNGRQLRTFVRRGPWRGGLGEVALYEARHERAGSTGRYGWGRRRLARRSAIGENFVVIPEISHSDISGIITKLPAEAGS